MAHARFLSSSRVLRTRNHYHILGVGVNATHQEIKSKFYELSRVYHPDAGDQKDAMRYRHITEAYAILSNTRKRQAFDATLGAEVRKPGGFTGPKRHARPQSGFRYQARPHSSHTPPHSSHTTPRPDSKLDPLRPSGARDSRVPHFEFDRKYQAHLRNDERRRAQYAQQQKEEETKDDNHMTAWGAGARVFGGVAAAVGVVYLFFR